MKRIENLCGEIERVNRQYGYSFTKETEMIKTVVRDYNGIKRAAKIIWVSRKVLTRRMNELGIPIPRKGGVRKTPIAKKFLSLGDTSNMSAPEIAEKINCYSNHVRVMSKKYNKPIKSILIHKTLTPDEIEELRNGIKSGKSYYWASRRFRIGWGKAKKIAESVGDL